MLEEYKLSYERAAEQINNWRTMPKMSLCNGYVAACDVDEALANAYLSAIVCRYWGMINKLIKSSPLIASPEDCYNFLVDGIVYALKHRKWLDTTSDLYNDPKAIDKIIMKCVQSERLTFYQRSKRQKRSININALSRETILEEQGDSIEEIDDSLNDPIDYTYELVVKYFKQQEYEKAFIVDFIAHDDVFDRKIEGPVSYLVFNINKLLTFLVSIDNSDCKIFADRYELDVDHVKLASSYIISKSKDRLKTKVEHLFRELRKDNMLQQQGRSN